MFQKCSMKVLAFAAIFCCCCLLSIGQTQNTYLLGLTNDHYSTIESPITPGNFVHVGTVANSTTSGTHDIHAMEVDGAGNIVWDWIYQTVQDERAFHVDKSPNGYIISGYVINNDGQPCHVLLLEIDFFGGILQQASYQDNLLGQHSSGLHVRSVAGDPLGGFIVAGIASTGLQDASSKAGMLLKVDAGLNAQWVRYYESPNGFNDHDMGSHVLEVPNKGYFMSGSCNAANGGQHVYGAMTDYTGTLLWDTEYADNNGNGHTSVAASAIYDAQTDQVIQLCNLSIIHHWGITTYDVATGLRDLNRSFRVFSNLGYANIQGFKLLQAPNPDHLIIAGYMRDHSWPEVDEAGNPTGNTLTGSPPFMCEVDKQGSTFLWDNMYLVPSPGYTVSSDIFGAFSAGQQPRILHPEMALRKSDGLGYWMNAYNNSGSGQFDIEIIELDLVGANPCSVAPLDFTFASSQWFDENNAFDIAGSVPTFTTGLQAMPITPQLVSCANTSCIPDAAFSITDLGDCCYQFDDLSPLPVGLSCPQTWDIIDLATGAHLCTGTGSSISCCFPTSGTYNICYEDCCVDADGNVVTSVHCENLVVDCQGCEVPDFDWNWVSSSADLCPNGGCSIGFNCPTAPDGSLLDPDKYCMTWDFGDGTVIAGDLGVCPIHCYADCGVYNACATVYCCEDDSQLLTVCHEVVVDCCCEVPDFDWDWWTSSADLCPNGGCSIGFNCPTAPDGSLLDPDKYCMTWDFGDGTVIAGDLGFCPIHCYADCGVYNACATVYCCEDDSQLLTVCHEVVVDCCCEVPDFDWDWWTSSADFCPNGGCSIGFNCPIAPDGSLLDPDKYCMTWDFGDGTVIAGDLGVCPIHCYADCGIYNACATVYCCEDDSQLLTVCHEVVVDCCCEVPDFGWNWVSSSADLCPNGGCSIGFNCPTAPDGSLLDPDKYCMTWDFGDGTVISGDLGVCPIHCYADCGVYTACATVYCCEDQSQFKTVCHEVVVDCCCEVPAYDWNWGASSADLCPNGGCSIGFNCPIAPDGSLLDPDKYCMTWDFGDGTVISGDLGVCPIHCYADCGVYTACATVYCCEDQSQFITVCHEVQVDCCSPCDLDPEFVLDPMSDCCYAFSDQTPTTEPGGNDCDYWEIIDASGVTIANAFGDFWQYCFQTSGSYVVCHTDCCLNADGTQETQTYCQNIFVDCGCPAPDVTNIVAVSGDNCEWGFCAEGDFGSNVHCATWDWGDGVVENHPLDVCPIHHYTCDGVYNVCVTVYCCEDESVFDTYCIELEVDCPCTLPQVDFEVGADECTVFTDVISFTDDPCPEGVCYEWDFGDGSDPVSGNPGATYTYSGSGVYVVCLTVYCCDDPALGYSFCKEVEVDCGCPVPDVTNIVAVSGDNCEWGFCAEGDFGSNVHCATWDWGDGVVENHPLDVCPTHHYTCDGIYNVCVTVYCCEDESVFDTYCIELEVDCPCTLPQVDFEVGADECTVFTDVISFTDDPCPEGVCYEWDFGDGSGPISGNPGATHTYSGSGVYVVCLTVYCCDDPALGYSFCKEVEVDCGCSVPELFDIQVVISDDCELGFCAIGDFDFDEHCVTWSWGDGIVENHPLDFCPLHQYICDGDYEVCATVYCCDDPSISTTVCSDVTVDCPCSLPTQADLIVGITDCDINACVIQAVSECPDDYCYTWDFGDGTSVANGGSCEPHSYASSGTYTVCVSIFCCDEPNLPGLVLCQEVTVECSTCVLPSDAGIDCMINDCTAAFGAIYTDDYSGSLCFIWDFGDGTPPALSEVAAHTYFASGTYTVCLYIHCCNDPSEVMTVCKDVTVECDGQCPEPCELHPAYAYTQNPFTFADGCCVNFTDLSKAGFSTTITGWSWDFGDGTISDLQHPTHCYLEPGVHTVCLTITGTSPEGDCTETFCWEVQCGAEDTCPGDLDHDGDTDTADLLMLLMSFGEDCE